MKNRSRNWNMSDPGGQSRAIIEELLAQRPELVPPRFRNVSALIQDWILPDLESVLEFLHEQKGIHTKVLTD